MEDLPRNRCSHRHTHRNLVAETHSAARDSHYILSDHNFHGSSLPDRHPHSCPRYHPHRSHHGSVPDYTHRPCHILPGNFDLGKIFAVTDLVEVFARVPVALVGVVAASSDRMPWFVARIIRRVKVKSPLITLAQIHRIILQKC